MQVCDHTVSEAVCVEQLGPYSGNTQLIVNTRSTSHIRVTECSQGVGGLDQQSQVGLKPSSLFTDTRAQAFISSAHSLVRLT